MNYPAITRNISYRGAALAFLATNLLMAQSAAPKPDAQKQQTSQPTQKVTTQQLAELDRQRLGLIVQLQELQAQIDAIEGVAPLKARINTLSQQIRPVLDKEKAAVEAYEKQEKCKLDVQSMVCSPASTESASQPAAKQ
jgi:ABC-type lipoprotein export system ATPase subunit